MFGMDFEPLHRGVYQFLVLVTTVITTSVQGAAPTPQSIQLKQPIVASSNLASIAQVSSAENLPSFYELGMEEIKEEKPEEIISALDDSSGLKIEAAVDDKTISNVELVQKFQAPLATPIPTPTPSPSPEPAKPPVKKAVLATEAVKVEPDKETAKTENPKEAIKLEIPQPPSSNEPRLNSDLIFQMINDHRTKMGLTPFEKDAKLCSLAEHRRAQLHNEIFGSGYVHQGLREMNLPYWITENMAGYGSEQANFNWWLRSSLHRSAIEGNYKYSCGACDKITCAQLFTSYIPK